MKDNRGFSLVELLIAVALIGIVTGASVLSINMISRANVDKGMRLVVDGMGKLQTECLSKSQPTYMYIYQDSDDGDYYMKFSKTLHTSVSAIMNDSQEAEMIESSKAQINVISARNGNSTIKDGNFIAIKYKKSDSSVVGYLNGTTEVKDLFRIDAHNGDKKAIVNISYETGKVNFSNEERN